MNALTEFSFLVICIVIANTTANRLTDGSLPNGDYGNDDDKLRQQLKQNKNLLASLQMQIQQLEGHQEEMKQQLDAHQRELHGQNHELAKLVHALLMRRNNDNLDQAIHNISKREIPSDAFPINNSKEHLNLLLDSGVTGVPCRDGKDGEPGKDGKAGRDGDAGRDGADGKDGDAGRDGHDGHNGKDGKDGKDGVDGDNGSNALDGAPGPPGPAGPTGVPGNDGSIGPQGPRGLPGADSTADVNSGAVYTRWGRTNCTSHSTLVYKGLAGSTNDQTSGGGTNFQCLPTDPEYNKFSGDNNGMDWYGSRMAGAKYSEFGYDIFPDSVVQNNVPCARCYTQNRAAVMMIPGKRTCPDDWTKEYEGYLMAGKDPGPVQSTFECVDSNPEYIPASIPNTDNTHEANLWFVKTDCSGMEATGHCPPYIARKELTCVVCTQ